MSNTLILKEHTHKEITKIVLLQIVNRNNLEHYESAEEANVT